MSIAEMSKDYFKINGTSCVTVGLYCDTPPVPAMAEQRYTDYQVGADEDSSIPDDSFKDVSYTLKTYTFSDGTDFNNNEIYKFLANASTLEISRYEGFYFKIKKVSAITPTIKADGRRIDYQIKLTLAPFKYSLDNETITLENGAIIVNKGSRYSKPTLYITGTGNVEINCNGDKMQLFNLDGSVIVVDSSRMITFKGDKLINNQVDGLYPMLSSGQNIISWTGDAEVRIKKNERYY